MRQSLTRMIRCALVTLIACFAMFTLVGFAATINVPSNATPTIQSGIDAASPGDTVLVAPGTYYENIDFKGKAITVTSGATSFSAATTVILDGSKGQNPAVVFRHNESSTSVLNGLTIRGGGFDSYPVPMNNYGTGGVLIQSAAPTISNNVLTNNFCNSIQANDSSPLIENNEIDNTLDNGQCGFAGGSAIWLDGSLASYNSGTTAGYPPAVVMGNLIQNNTQSGRDDAGGNGGSGVAVWGAIASIVGNTIRNNSTLGDGGAILSFNTDIVSVIGNLIYGNSAGTDGAISMQPPEDSVGPFIGIVASNTIYGNAQTSSLAGLGDAPSAQVYLDANLGQYLVANNIIVASDKNSVAVACGTIYNYLSLTPLVFDHNDLYNPDGGEVYGGACPDQTGTYGNLSADPLFSNTSTGDFTLRSGSPAIDTGNNSAPQLTASDLAGAARIQDGTGLGYPVVDMGAYEFAGRQDLAPVDLTLVPSEYFSSTAPVSQNQSNLTFTATLTSSAGTPTGPVKILVDGQVVTTVTVPSSGSITFSLPGLIPGLHAFTATYAGSGQFPPAVSVKFYLLIPLYGTTLNFTSTPNPSLLGQTVTFAVTSSSTDTSFIPSPITVTDTTNGSVVLATLTPNSSGVATFPTSSLSLGDHFLSATYAGDSTHASAQIPLSQDVVNGYATTTNLSSSLNPANVGQTVNFTATVTSANGTPTGLITFTDGATTLGVQTMVNGVATFTTSTLAAGTHQIFAAYSPAGITFSASNATLPQVINGIATSTSLAVAPTSAVYGTNIVMTSTVNLSGSPNSTGSITFMDGATAISTQQLLPGSSTTSINYASLAVGTHSITAVFSGDATHNGSTSAPVGVTITATPTTLGLSVTPNPGFALQPIALTAKLAGGPTTGGAGIATINFLANGTVIGSATTDAQGNVTLPASLVTGNYTLTAVFAGTASLAASTSPPVAEIINPNSTSTAVFAQPDPGYQGGNETITATVGTLFSSNATPPVPVGTVAFFDAGVLFATANLDARGQANFSTAALTVGSHSIVATYLGTPNFLNSTASPYILNILPRDFTLTTDPTITIQTEHHKDLNLTLTSIGDFTDAVALSCVSLPSFATCTFRTNGPVLASGATQTSSVHIDTDALLNYISGNAPASHLQSSSRLGSGVAYGLLLPFTLIAALRRRRKLRRIIGPCIGLSVLLIVTTFTGCSGHYPGHTAPGTYTFTVTGAGATTHLSHTAAVTLTVTE